MVVTAVAVVLGVLLLQAGNHTPSSAEGTSAGAPATTTTAPGHGSGTSGAAKKKTTTTTTTFPNKGKVNVLVANGTSVANGATDYASELKSDGWNTQPPADTTTPVNSSNVYYAAGQQSAATAVASQLGLKPSAVQPLTTAVPVSSTAGTDVLVVLGPDLTSHLPATTTTT